MGLNRRTFVLYVSTDMEAATTEINTRDGAVTLRLSNVVFVASMPSDFRASDLKNSSTSPPSNALIDDFSKTMITLWKAVQDRDLLIPALRRRIGLPRRGLAAVAVVMPSHLKSSVFPLVLAGAHSLAELYASEPMNKRLSFVFEPYLITSITPLPIDSSGSKTLMSAYPSVVSFNNRLYCFYRGRSDRASSGFYKVFDGSSRSWSSELQLPSATVKGGPSAVVFGSTLYIFEQLSNNYIYYSSFNGSSWSAFTPQASYLPVSAGPTVTVFDNKLYYFVAGSDNVLWFNAMNSGLSWEGNKKVDESLITGSPSPVVFKDSIYCFYQGAGNHANVLMLTVVSATGSYTRPRPVLPNSAKRNMAQMPSAAVVGGKLYCFHQDQTGKLCAVVSSDGLEWGEYTFLENVSTLCEGLATINFNNELYFFYQAGEGGKVTSGEMWHIKLKLQSLPDSTGAAASVDWKLTTLEGADQEPSLEELKYSKGYKGFIQLATHMQTQHSASYGYVVYIAHELSPLLFDAYADATRMCLQHSESSLMQYSFAKMFAAEGTFDQRLVNSKSTYPPRLVSQEIPRYTLAWAPNWNYVLANASIIMVHRPHEPSKDPRLWVLFLDKRNSRWVEMEGPRITYGRGDDNAAPACQFGPASKLYVFYHAGASNGEMHYNVLGATNEVGKKVWEVEKVMRGTSGSNTPSPISVGRYMHVFHSGPNEGEEFRYTSLDTRANYWADDRVAYKFPRGGSPSTVQYMDRILAFHKGFQGECKNQVDAKITHSIWDKDKLTWQKADVNDADSPHSIHGDLTAVAHGDFVYVFYVSDGDCIWWNQFDGTAWRGPTRVSMTYPDVRPMDGGVAACACDDKIHCFFRGGRDADKDSTLIFYKVFNTIDCTWNDEVILPTASGFSSKPGVVHNQPPANAS